MHVLGRTLLISPILSFLLLYQQNNTVQHNGNGCHSLHSFDIHYFGSIYQQDYGKHILQIICGSGGGQTVVEGVLQNSVATILNNIATVVTEPHQK
jgi:hypothetical protein